MAHPPTQVPATPAEASPTRLAATILLLRPAELDGTPEILMLRRSARSGFAASAWVFPGGVVDSGDASLPADLRTGFDPAAPHPSGQDPDTLLGLHVAAAREMFEEAGVLLARDADGAWADTSSPDMVATRAALNDRQQQVDFAAFLARNGLTLDLGGLTYWLRWVTPIQEPKRYDTAFFLAQVPEGATPHHDEVETTETRWISAADALADDDFPIIFPTMKTLAWMAEHATLEQLVAHARGQEAITPTQPHIFVAPDGRYTGIVLPGDPDFPEEVYA